LSKSIFTVAAGPACAKIRHKIKITALLILKQNVLLFTIHLLKIIFNLTSYACNWGLTDYCIASTAEQNH
jgi:hypothetical protein